MRDSISSISSGRRDLLLPLSMVIFVAVVAFSGHANAGNGSFVTFDVPGCSRDILPLGLNAEGTVTGTCGLTVNSNVVFVGFVRARDGTSTIINVPGSASTQVGEGELASPAAGPPINSAGAIAGYYSDASGANHGFLRAPDGIFTTFDAPGAVTGTGFLNGTEFVCCISPTGAIVGVSFDANIMGHGFLRAPNGTFTTFDPPGSTLTLPNAINPVGVITGAYIDASGAAHGFVRDRDGTINTFDVPGAVNGTSATGVNPAGAITGFYFDANFVFHGFLRAPDGMITTFDAPGSTASFGTEPVAITPTGAIVGSYSGQDMFHGFFRSPDGTLTTIDPPGSTGTGLGAINPAGLIAGNYGDANGVLHGFVFVPH